MQYFYVIKNMGHHARLRGRTIAPIQLHVWQLPGIRTSRKKGRMFLHFQSFQHFRSAFFSFFATNFHLFFPTMPFQNPHFSHARAFRQGNPPLYFAAGYVLLCTVQDAQCNTEESP